MANYKPKNVTISAASTKSGIVNAKNASTSLWVLALIKGSALTPTGAALASGAILIWSDAKDPDVDAPDYTTFTDQNGQFGITVKANTAYDIRFYSK
ncbi:hypothetical protein [Clostridium gasigenes]|uniref:Uncharacterized protein n=1 Tax=Clostridium gasigenes TaxID=94869 RepID=A0A1H0NUC0_9CLOT|nr:hypothetical protein [Clostridium gasigenes]MBU3105431.1 hypothetical protein [Clostridium gasigenes]MBU3131829.1 hypothetical protein [Clostridium gasigenes]NKF05594.1 hypothetical protein [Clostridium gasigenes]QSW19035.1 hypothetical protein J1C67_16040 [Clostridium gasigenes]SDO96108.1 hypothetical protein SAMN04488529_101954 [Clostridium gasigenes]